MKKTRKLWWDVEKHEKKRRKEMRRHYLSDKQKRVKGEIGMLCKIDENGRVLKSYITVENFKRIKKLMNTLNIKVVQATHTRRSTFSYRQYCKLFESYIFKSKKCDGEVCCQAITEEGNRCRRPASRFSSMDLTETQVLPTIPNFIQDKLGTKKVEELKLIGFANTCCFYCWQHAAMFVGEKVTWATNLLYYSTHPEDILSIFYDDVKAQKFLGTVTYYIGSLGKLRSFDEVIKYMFKTYGITHGAFNTTYWAIFGMVFMYDTLKPILLRYLHGSGKEKNKVLEEMSETATKVLLELHKM